MAIDCDIFASRILRWFERQGRKDLPWQQNPSPYRVWVSEIMLQQTRVHTVIPYFQRFMAEFPDLLALADAAPDRVLHLWSGLGYYARARNLHKAARYIRDQHGGHFPEQFDAVQSLPGVGRSTAGAILSLACGQRHAILDGNVKRVLARFFAVEGWPGRADVLRTLWDLAEGLMPLQEVAAYNQAMMDLGATVCTRTRAACERCPLQDDCQAYQGHRVQELPSPKPRRDLPARDVQMLLLVNQDGEVYLEQRPPSGIWGGLWSFPEFRDQAEMQAWCDRHGVADGVEHPDWEVVRHTFSHFHLDITPHIRHLQNPQTSVMEAGQGIWYNTRQPPPLGLAAPVQRLIARLQELN